MGDGQHPYQYQYQQPSEGSVRRISDHTRPPHGWTAPQSNPYPPPPPVAYDRGSPASVKEDDKGKGKDEDPLSLVAGFDPRLLSGRVKLATKNTTNSACINCHKRKRKCDRAQPKCSNCAKSAAAKCEYDLRITPNSSFLPDLIAQCDAQRARIAWLEDFITKQDTSLADIPSIPTGSALAAQRPRTPAVIVGALGLLSLTASSESPQYVGAASNSSFSAIAKELLSTGGGPGTSEAPMPWYPRMDLPEVQTEVQEDGMETAPWPPIELAKRFIGLFFTYNAVAYPFLQQSDIYKDLEQAYSDQKPAEGRMRDYSTYRLFLIFAIGSTWLEQLGGAGRSITMSLRNRALQTLPAVLQVEDIHCVSGLILLALYSVYDRNGPNLWSVVGLATRLALALGLHRKAPGQFTEAMLESRRRVFWSLYCLDRLISFTLARPMAIQDDDIDVEFPTVVASENPSQDSVPSMLFTHQIIRMRRLYGIILNQVFRNADPKMPQSERHRVLSEIHAQIDNWIAHTPQSAASANEPIGKFGSSASFFDMNHKLLITSLYRPSPLFPQPTSTMLATLCEASGTCVALYKELHKDARIVENYINLFNIMVSCISLLYSLVHYGGDARNSHSAEWRVSALQQVQMCQELLDSFCVGWPNTDRYRETFKQLADVVITRHPDAPNDNGSYPPAKGTSILAPGASYGGAEMSFSTRDLVQDMWIPQIPWDMPQMHIPNYIPQPPVDNYMNMAMGDMSAFNDGMLPLNAQGLWDRVG